MTGPLDWLDRAIAAEAERLSAATRPEGTWPGAAVTGLLNPVASHRAPLPEDLPAPWPPGWALDRDACAVILALAAPDLDARYGRLYAILNDDVRLGWLTRDLAHRLLGPASRALDPGGALRARGLCTELPDAPPRSRPTRPMRLHRHALDLLTGAPPAEGRLWPAEARLVPLARAELTALLSARDRRPLVIFDGADAPSHRTAAQAALASQGRALLTAPLPAEDRDLADLLLLAELRNAGLMLSPTPGAPPRALPLLNAPQAPVILSTPGGRGWAAALDPEHPAALFPDRHLTGAARAQLWTTALASAGLSAPEAAVDEIARRHAMTLPEIRRSVRALQLDALRNGETAVAPETLQRIVQSTRRPDLGPLAQRMNSRATLDDLVLPEATQEALADLIAALEHSARVLRDWGFGAVGQGRQGGIAALFTGASGTGKTMAAGIVAASSGHDLWRIDISGLVSKYIGETEKNLDRVFRAARRAGVALFFDEADAIFGARSEVRDAHDRYANLETAYLLQRLEDHDGPVLLASNIASNIDAAFLRRLDFVVEFPRPDAALRAEIWRRALPDAAPLAADIDLGFLAAGFDFAGGDIRAAALDAGFRAARLGTAIDMRLLCKAVARQMAKHGRVPGLAEFGPYRHLLSAPPMPQAAE